MKNNPADAEARNLREAGLSWKREQDRTILPHPSEGGGGGKGGGRMVATCSNMQYHLLDMILLPLVLT